jgi:hypothetical protein
VLRSHRFALLGTGIVALYFTGGCSSSPGGTGAPPADAAAFDGALDAAPAVPDASHGDASATDASIADAAPSDAAIADATLADSASTDAAASDAATSGDHDATALDGSTTDAATTDAEVEAGPKTPLLGLIDMQTITWHNFADGGPTFNIANADMFPGLLGGIVINATWSALQPLQAGALDFTAIDSALALVRTYNAANPSAPLGVKLRVYGGTNAPDWAKAIGGPINIVRNMAGCPNPPCNLTIGAYWTTGYIAAWRAFQTLLAARYDTEPLIHQVAVTSCASQTDEPFVSTSDTGSRANLMDAGLTDTAQQACLTGAIDDYGAWTNTLIDYTFNVYVKVGGGGTVPAFTTTVMDLCRSTLGPRCVLDNHALSYPPNPSDALVYSNMQSATVKGPINFQTQAPNGFACEWTGTIAQGVAYGASAIEVWPDSKFSGIDTLQTSQVAQLASEFTTPIPVPPVPDAGVDGSCPGFF